MIDPLDFTGKVALVTGSSRGIGAGIVTALGKHGARCIVNFEGDPQDTGRADAIRIAAALPGARILQCDVGDAAQVASMMDFVKSEFGGLDILVNNAGLIRNAPLASMTAAEWDIVMRVNCTGVFHCIQSALPILRDGGRIVNISSVSGQAGFPSQANYSSSKAAVIALTKVAARELAARSITVNAIAPGFIKTEMTRHLPDAAVAQILANLPLGRFGDIEDIVHAALFLCSGDARYITGQVLNVNGGLNM
jgi:3-oxoacyl-[acyl-carrier protein] reductase